MMKPPVLRILPPVFAAAMAAAVPLAVHGEVAYVEPAKPYSASPFLKEVEPGKVDLSRGTVNIPLITWAADGVTVSSNDGLAPNAGSALAKAMGVNANLELVDNFD